MARVSKKVGSKTETAAADTGGQSAVKSERPFLFLHIGDLHVTALPPGAPQPLVDRQNQLKADIAAVLADIASINPQTSYDFVYLPGDLAENACKAEYDILWNALQAHLGFKVRVIPGDHDRARGSMTPFADFRASLKEHQEHPEPKYCCMEIPFDNCPAPDKTLLGPITQYYFDEEHSGVLCLFLDLVSASQTRKVLGLDFRLGIEQFGWLTEKIMGARQIGQPCAVFMHCYPEDMREPDDRRGVAGLFWDGRVRLVEMGHTHYNEIAHDGRTTYAAARSVGQNEDGPVGYAVGAIDRAVTSWRFKQLQQTWPFVLITSPADTRLATEALSVSLDGQVIVRAVVLSDRSLTEILCQCRVDDGQWIAMTQDATHSHLFHVAVEWWPGSRKISVKATDGRWHRGADFMDIDTIEPASTDFKPPMMPTHAGSDKLRVGTWKKKGVRGDRLGPNSGGRKW